MNPRDGRDITTFDRSALRRAVTNCVVAHDRLIGRLRAVVAIGRTNLDWADVTAAHACAAYREFVSVLPAYRRASEAFERTAAAHDAFHAALGTSLDDALAHAPQASPSIDIGGTVVAASELFRASLYDWVDEA